MYILGISAFYHDSAAALIQDGKIIAAAQEERFTRKKHDPGFPAKALRYCLKEAGIGIKDLNGIVFYDKPLLKFERLLETYLSYAPRGLKSFVASMPVWLKEKLFLKSFLKKELSKVGSIKEKQLPEIFFSTHHESHAASAFYPSPFQSAAVLCLDGVGEWASTSVWFGDGKNLELKWGIDFPHSLGLLYSAFTYYTGFKVNSGEYKLMGLAPYGEPRYLELILDKLIDVKTDGTFRLNMDYFNYPVGLTMTNDKFHALFGALPRVPEAALTQREMDIAASIQKLTEMIILRLANTLYKELGAEYLCLAGGVALNCVANGRVLRESPFKDIWIQPAAGDAGGALGAALALWHKHFLNDRTPEGRDMMRGAYLGPSFSEDQIKDYLDSIGAAYEVKTEDELLDQTAYLLESGAVIGWFQDRMEFGPRALGNRSIIGDARNQKMQSIMNVKIKYRESFRPFAPIVLAEDAQEYFELNGPSPYMLLVADVKSNLRIPMTEEQDRLFGIDKLNIPRSTIPAVTHVDYSARVQTVHKETNSKMHRLIQKFKERTGCPVLVNTSFNVRGEPIVCTPEDAYRCFMRTGMDYLVLGNFILRKADQKKEDYNDSWKEEFHLD
ncbi:MAG: carbamoyltransferase [Candidatus Magasanikbacteria bacterium]|nr:carbamoyltransferase [Candidatus Magasanikbacteria bacterium]